MKRRTYLKNRDIFATPEEKKTMVEIWERWCDIDGILK